MTAKEELRDIVDGLTEERARALLLRLREEDDRESPLVPGRLSHLSPKEQSEALRKMFEEWGDKGTLTEEEWEEFARDFDAQRPHRPLFTQYLR